MDYAGSFKNHKNTFLNDPKSQKKGFLTIFWSLVCWIDLILHIVIVLNVFQPSAMLPGHEGSFKDHKNAFLNDPEAKKRFLAIFWSLVCWIDLTLHIMIVQNVLNIWEW